MLNQLKQLREIRKKKLRSGLQKLINNTLWLFAERFIQLFVGFFVSVWVARYLGPEQLGLYSYALVIVGLATAFSGLGLDSIVIRDLSRCPSNKNVTLGTAFVLKLLARGFAAILAVIAIFFLKSGNELAHLLVSTMAIGQIFLSAEAINFWFYSQTRARLAVWAKNLAYLAASFLKVCLVLTNAPLLAFAWVFLIENSLIAIGLFIMYGIDGHSAQNWRVSLKHADNLLKQSWFLMFSGILIAIYMQVDQLMLGQMVGTRAVGLYSVVVKLSELWYFIPIAIANSIFPTVVRSKELGETRYYQRLQNLFRLMVILSYAASIILTFSINIFVPMLYGEEYVAIIPIVYVYVWSGVFVSLGMATYLWAVNEGFMKISLINSLLGAAVNVILNYILIPRYEIMGATVATLISQLVGTSLAYFIFRETRSIVFMQMKAIFIPGIPNKGWFE